jgi:hypothetical protein
MSCPAGSSELAFLDTSLRLKIVYYHLSADFDTSHCPSLDCGLASACMIYALGAADYYSPSFKELSWP